MLNYKKRKYYVRNDRGSFMEIKHGSSVFVSTSINDVDQVDDIHKEQGVSISEVKAAELCGMCNNWTQFFDLVDRFRRKIGVSVH